MNLGTQDVGVSISAAGTTQATAQVLINGISGLTTVASGSGVVLLSAGSGASQFVYNGGANAVKVYPPVAVQINGLGLNNPHVLSANTACEYWTLSSTQIIALLSA